LNYLLDTNIISELISPTPNENALNFITKLDETKIYLSVVTIGEIQFGIERLQEGVKKERLKSWLFNDLLNKFDGKILDIDVKTMLTWGKINQRLKSIGKPLPIMDSLIGATCMTHLLTLVTRNEKDFQNLNIQILNPF
jgi:predicted nucleic acid-binding protein